MAGGEERTAPPVGRTSLAARYADRTAPLPAGMHVEASEVVYTALARDDLGTAIGHLTLRRHAADALEIKRVYVCADHRRKGVARALMIDAEQWAASNGVQRLVLHTGDRQPDAVRLYERLGYQRIPLFPPYDAMPYSHCFEKVLAAFH
jgi:GNAT superfamily N-acetyltransferase